jgi:hypothetical protein
VQQLREELAATQHRPTDVTRWQRTKHLLLQGIIFYLGALVVLLGIVLAEIWQLPALDDPGVGLPIVMAALIIVVFLCSNLSFRIMGISLVRSDGRPASWIRWLGRTLLTWGYLMVLGMIFIVGAAIVEHEPSVKGLGFAFIGAAGVLLLGYLALLIWLPSRAPHDRLLGIYLVPE